jgi:two-component system cell cycle sensor histidine kinase/response regulator CckA
MAGGHAGPAIGPISPHAVYPEVDVATVHRRAGTLPGAQQRVSNSSRTQADLAAELDVLRERLAALEASGESVRTRGSERFGDELFKLALKAARVGAWEWDIGTNAVFWSDEVASIFGMEPGEFAGTYEAYLDLIPEGERGGVVRAIKQSLTTGVPYVVEHSFLTTDGDVRWLAATGSVLQDADGKPTHMIGVVADITARKRAEQSVIESEERFRAFAEASLEGIAFTRQGLVIDASPRVATILGYEAPGELIGRSVSDFVAPEDLELVRSHQEAGDEHGYEHRALRKDGTTLYVEATGRQVTFRGEPCRMVALRDVTERRRTDSLLRQRDETIRAIVESSRDWIWAIDSSGAHTYCNPAVESILGYSPAELAGRSTFELLHPDDRELVERKLPEWVSSKTGWRGLLLRWRHKDGGYRHLESSGVPILNEAGDLAGFRGVDRDVTDRMGLVEEKEKLLAQLRQAQKMEAVGQLAGGIAHDFNNILTAILANAELVERSLRRDPPPYAAALDSIVEIEASARRAASLTGQLLTFSRRRVSKPQVLDLNAVLGDLHSMLRRLITESIQLRLVTARGAGPVYVDPAQLQQVIMNLVVNASDAMPEGGVLTLETSCLELGAADVAGKIDVVPGRYSVLSVTDTGHGMDRKTLQRIFEPFFTTKGIGKGTGLGLATAYGIVRQAGGYIAVYSEPGVGTTFRVHLPVTARPLDVSGSARQTAAPPSGTEVILVCEDESTVRKLTVTMLTQAGYSVIEAADGRDALRAASASPEGIELLVTDVIMPEMDGRALSQALTARIPSLKTLFCSGYTADVISHHGVLDPRAEFLEKPFTRRQLLDRVRRILDD